MEDAHLPPDANDGKDDGKGDQARRAGRRLSDTETVASTRRDMFGDGPLIDVVALPQQGPDPTQGAQDAAAPDVPMPPPLADAATVYNNLYPLPGIGTDTPAATSPANI